jgi:hypothetical protein
MLDKRMFAESITGLSEMFEKKMSQALMKMYYEVLKDMSEEDFKASIMKLMSEWSYSYMPKPAHIKNALVDNVSLEVEAQNEWKLVIYAIERIGRYKNVIFQNVVTNTAVQIITGGKWSDLCNMNYEQLDWIKKDFVKFYVNIRKNPTNIKDNALLGINEDTKVVMLKSSVNDTKILKSNQIKSKIDSKKQHINKLVAKSIKTF